MSRSKKWKNEWSFFLGENGRRQYKKVCKRCVHDCKQSFKTDLIQCPPLQKQRGEKHPRKGLKKGKNLLCISRKKDG